MKTNYFFCFIFCFFNFFAAQENAAKSEINQAAKTNNWEYDVSININFLNMAFYDWMGGGSTFLNANTKDFFIWNYKGTKIFWLNRVQFDFGGVYNYNPKQDFPLRKTDDLLSYMTNLDYTLDKHWSVVMIGNFFKTQVDIGFYYGKDNLGNAERIKTSDIFSPAFNYTFAGIRYRYESEKTKFMAILTPVTYQQVFVSSQFLSDQGIAGIPKGKHWRGNIGWLIYARYDQILYENMNLFSQLDVFGRYEDDGGVLVNWQTGLSLKIYKYFFLNAYTELLYDHYMEFKRDDGSIGRALQLRYFINLGIAMRFTNIP